mmetsp:Transcript_48006/g.96189  ORF Transcript_48006/g.96189 Transcript_48006/m.96189 type:complete len:121 (+) Transcript_48006:51-413(+)
MPPKKPDPKAKGKPDPKAAKAPPPSDKPRGPVLRVPPEAPPLPTVKVEPPAYDPRIHEPPIYMSSFWDFPGRRPHIRPEIPAMVRPGGGGGAAAAPTGKGKADPKDKKGKKDDPKAKKKK